MSFAQTHINNLHFTNWNVIDIKSTGDIKGTKFLYGDWNNGILVLNDSLFFMKEYIALDAFDSKLFIKENENSETVFELSDFNLTGFSIIEKETNEKHQFVVLSSSNFKDIEPEGYYEIIENIFSTNYLLKKTQKVLYDPNKSRGTAAVNNIPKEYQEKVTYFLKNEDGLFVEVKLKKKDIMQYFTKHTSVIDSYIKAKKINFSKEKQVSELVNYYYSLD